jgi:hypothetical protein
MTTITLATLDYYWLVAGRERQNCEESRSKITSMSPSGLYWVLGILCLLSYCFCGVSSFTLSRPHHSKTTTRSPRLMSYSSNTDRCLGEPHVENVLFIECGFGNDSHGQDATKAAGTLQHDLFFRMDYFLCFMH